MEKFSNFRKFHAFFFYKYIFFKTNNVEKGFRKGEIVLQNEMEKKKSAIGK